jgi:AraC family transcriptional regulator
VLDPSPQPALVDPLAFYLCGELLRRHSTTPRHGRVFDPDGSARRLERAVELMHSRLSDPISLQDLADAAGMSRFRFAHLFKTRHGISPYAFLTRLRVERAAERIRTSDVPLTWVAHEMGFGSGSRFSAAFRERYGVSPSAWRARDKNRSARRRKM